MWISERDGWQHVYLYSRTGEKIRLLTPENFDVIVIYAIDEQNGWFYYIASLDNLAQHYLYRIGLDGKGKPIRVSPAEQAGTHSYQMSPGLKWAFHTHLTVDLPPVTDLVRLPQHKVVRTLVDNAKLRDKLNALKRRPTAFLRVDIGDGIELDGWCMKPHDFDPGKCCPLLFFVYGEPAGQTVLDSWAGDRFHRHV